MPDSGRKGDPHGWNTLENYVHVHSRHMEVFQSIGFVVEDLLEFVPQDDPEELVISGRIRCQHNLFVDVDKTLSTQTRHGRVMVKTIRYAYHAGFEGRQDRPIFRNDNAHPHPGHADAHHKHRFDLVTGRRIDPPE